MSFGEVEVDRRGLPHYEPMVVDRRHQAVGFSAMYHGSLHCAFGTLEVTGTCSYGMPISFASQMTRNVRE